VLAQPSFVEARYALAMEFARQNKMGEALEQFAETVRLRPEMAEAHFNYGVALAKATRYSEAVREFRESLRLNPSDAKAKEFLQRATALGGG
jgi:Flp pilus assembly protein TadD